MGAVHTIGKAEVASGSNVDFIKMICNLDEIKKMKIAVNSCLIHGDLEKVVNSLNKLGSKKESLQNFSEAIKSDKKYRLASDVLMNDLNKDQEIQLAKLIRCFLAAEDITTVKELMDRKSDEDSSFSEAIKLIVECFLQSTLKYNIKLQ